MTIYTVKLLSGKVMRVVLTWLGNVPDKKDIARAVKQSARKDTAEEVIEIRRLMTNQLIWKKG